MFKIHQPESDHIRLLDVNFGLSGVEQKNQGPLYELYGDCVT